LKRQTNFNLGGKMDAIADSLAFYESLTDAECEEKIVAAKQILGNKLAILGHHYQREEVFKHADFTGDSLKLSREAAQSQAQYIVFAASISWRKLPTFCPAQTRSSYYRIFLLAVPWRIWPISPRYCAPGQI